MRKHLRVFIASLDPLLTESLVALASSAGHKPEVVAVPWYQAVRDQAPDLLLLDLGAAEGRGEDLLRRLVRHRLTARTPVIVLSERTDLEYELIDAFDFLNRPPDPDKLLEDLALLTEKVDGDRVESAKTLGTGDALPFQEFLHHHAGLHFDQRNLRMLERGLRRRMQAVQAGDFLTYFRYLEKNHEKRGELKKLLSLLTVGETYFFRYRSDREALVNHVLPELIRRRHAERTLRIWSAGCSTGEEPHSIAILLLEHFPQLADWTIDILATDINKRSLRQARQGIYRGHALRMTAGPYREKYFLPLGDDLFLLAPEVRRLVRFAYHNLQSAQAPIDDSAQRLDLIFCRNVLIYFRRETFRKIIEQFYRHLEPGGYFFLGHAENLAGMGDLFHRSHQQGAFFYKRLHPPKTKFSEPLIDEALSDAAPAANRLRPSPALSPVMTPLQRAEHRPDPADLLRRAREAFDREEFTEASRRFLEILQFFPENVEALIGQGLILANHGNYQEARQLCARVIRIDDLCPEAYLLRGLILDMEEEPERAAVEYQKVLWLKMDAIMPRYYLSKVHRRLGRSTEAVREMRIVMRQLQKLAPETILPFSGGLSREVLLEICREELAKMPHDH